MMMLMMIIITVIIIAVMIMMIKIILTIAVVTIINSSFEPCVFSTGMSQLHTICNINPIRLHFFNIRIQYLSLFFGSFPSVLSTNVTDASFRKPLWPSVCKCLYKCSCKQDSFLSRKKVSKKLSATVLINLFT